MTTIDIPAEAINSPAETTPDLRLDKARAAVAKSAYPDACKKAIVALLDLMDERGWSQADAGRAIKHGRHKKPISSAALSQLLGGTYAADPTALCKSIAAAVDHERGRTHFGSGGFAETRLYSALIDLADIAVLTQRIACFHGGILEGKTTAAKALVDNYHRAACVFFTAPYADTYGAFIRRLARVRGIDIKGSLSDLREAIIASLDRTHLLIVDEFHQPLLSYPHSQAVRCLEFLREINDLSRCGILLVGSTVGYAALASDDAFARLHSGLSTVDVSASDCDLRPLADGDIAAICQTYGLTPDERRLVICRDVIQDHNVARLFDILRLASGNADRDGKSLTWSYVTEIIKPTLKLAA